MYFVVGYWRIGALYSSVTKFSADVNTFHCSSAADAFTLEVQETEENFDLALIASLEIDVIPQLGDSRIPDLLVTQLAKVLHQGSRLHDSDVGSGSESPMNDSMSKHRSHDSHDFETVSMSEYGIGSTGSGTALPRERFSYWCFDLLFLICSDTAKGLSRSLAAERIALISSLLRSRSISQTRRCFELALAIEPLPNNFGQICR